MITPTTRTHPLPKRPGAASGGRRNVSVFTPSAMGGHARYTRELLEALAERGERRDVFPSLITSVDLAHEHRSSAYPIHDVLPRLAHRREFRRRISWVGSRLAHYPRRERQLLRWVDDRPDLHLIHLQEHAPWLAPWLYRSLRRRGIALVETVHNIRPHRYWNGLHRVARDTLERAAWRQCDALIVHTEGLRESLSTFLGGNHPPIHVTPHAVWTGRVTHTPVPPGHAGSLLFFGVIRENKGLHVLLKAMARLPECRLIVAGASESSHYQALINEMIQELPPGRVEVRDRFVSEDEAAELFEGCGLVVLPYTSFASQSGVLHQAVAHGRPVVASDVGALGETVREWGVGEVVPPEDDRALVEAIGRMLRPKPYRAAVSAAERVRGELTWASMAEATLDVYRSVLS